MKAFLIAVTLGVSSFGVISGASIHTLIEAQAELDNSKMIAVKLVSMSLSELARQDI